MQTKELIIIGAGTAGLYAALAAHHKKCREIYVLEHESIPSVFWPKLAGLTLETEATVLSLNSRKQLTFTGPHIGYQQLQAKSLILATGSLPTATKDSSALARQPDAQLCRDAGILCSPITQGPLVNEMFETSLRGVFACGDVLFLHEDPTLIAQEGTLTGTAAAIYLQQGLFRKPFFPVVPSGLLTYATPSSICPTNLPERFPVTLCASRPGRLLRIFRDNIIWKEIPWPGGRQGRQASICLYKKDILSLRYRLTFELKG